MRRLLESYREQSKIRIIADGDSSLELARFVRPAVFERDSGGGEIEADEILERVFELPL